MKYEWRLKAALFKSVRRELAVGVISVPGIYAGRELVMQTRSATYAGWRGLAPVATEVSKLLHWSPSSQLASVSGM